MRTVKTVGGKATYYFWDGNKLVAENGPNGLIWYYYDESGVCGMNFNGTDYYFQKNILGDVVGVYDATGKYIGGYTYDAWGNVLMINFPSSGNPAQPLNPTSPLNVNPFRYRSYYLDSETNLYYLQSRYYDPQTSRFLNADDPTMLYQTATTVFGANLYAYCANNPVMFSDSTGQFFLWDWIKAGAKAVANVVGAGIELLCVIGAETINFFNACVGSGFNMLTGSNYYDLGDWQKSGLNHIVQSQNNFFNSFSGKYSEAWSNTGNYLKNDILWLGDNFSRTLTVASAIPVIGIIFDIIQWAYDILRGESTQPAYGVLYD